jgi:hypothetical protein
MEAGENLLQALNGINKAWVNVKHGDDDPRFQDLLRRSSNLAPARRP